jgi:uncharacterized protein YlxW (UPF0749 family)
MVLGMGLSQQIRLVSRLNNTTRVQQGRILTFLVTRTVEQNQTLKNQIDNLLDRVNNLPSSAVAPMAEKLAVAKRMAGLTPVEGPGVEVTLHDAAKPSYPGEPPVYQLVHDQYVLHVVALLSAATVRFDHFHILCWANYPHQRYKLWITIRGACCWSTSGIVDGVIG